jgi:hypothetical protein
MSGALFTLAFFFVVAALAWRRVTRARAIRALERDVRAREDPVRAVSDYAAVDAAVRAARCGACDGKLAVLSEGPSEQLVVVDLRCVRCGERVRLRFRGPDA